MLKFIDTFSRSNGYPPTLKEVGEGTGYSLTGARKVLIALEEHGYVRRNYHKSRALQVLKLPTEEKAAA